jgi:pyruvate dehydrogenase E2 component (dihydrolipoamide acetyltransferase)
VALVALEIPKVGLVMESARLVRWLKKVGERVSQGEPLLELETEKSVVEIESTESGRLVELLLDVDQEARVGDRIAWVEVESGALARGPTTANSAAASPAASKSATQPSALRSGATSASERVRSSPVARRLAAEHSLDLSRIAGTGPRGRVQLIDVQRTVEANAAPRAEAALRADATMAPTRAPPTAERSQPLSNMRRAVARSMTLSNATIPQFNVERSVDWTTIQTRRGRFAAEPADAPRPSVNDFLLQAVARALLSFPALNATFSGDANSPDATLIPANGTHIGLVVSVEDGLLVPVFHRVEELELAELARRRADTVDRALNGKLKREELEGATFSISNLGTRGPDRFTALISPPQSAILAVGRLRDCVVPHNGELVVRPVSQLTLTVDHRVVDGRLASDFLARLVELLEGQSAES